MQNVISAEITTYLTLLSRICKARDNESISIKCNAIQVTHSSLAVQS